MSSRVPGPIRFEEFDLDVERYQLRRAGHAVKLERIPMELLILLLQSEGKLVRRESINRQLWGENALQDTEHSVNTAVNKLRYILRDNASKPRFIQTVVGQGYRFIANVVVEPVAAATPSLQEHPAEVAPVVPIKQPAFLAGIAPAAGLVSDRVELTGGSLPIASASTTGSASTDELSPEPLARRKMWLFGLLIVAGLFIMVGLVGLLLRFGARRSAGRPPVTTARSFQSVAILPFANLAQNADQDYIVDGMTDQLITDLASSTPLRVTSRSSVMHFKGSQIPISEIGQSLHADVVLEGSFLHNGREVRITANLIDVKNDRHLWAQVYEESGDDLLSLQELVTRDIAREVARALGTEASAAKLQPVSLKARDAYLRGRFLWSKRTPESVRQSIDFYKLAIAADPKYAEAYAALGDAYILMSSYSANGPAIELQKAQQAADHALLLGGGLAEAHTVLAAVRIARDWDWAGGEAEYKQALALNPSYPTARHWYSLHLARLGRMQAAEAEIQRARALDPLSVVIATNAAETAYWARNPVEAMKRIDEVLALNPDFAEAHLVKGKIYVQLKQYEPALAEFKRARQLAGGHPNIGALQGHALALAGATDQALSIARQMEETSLHSYVSGVDIAEVYCGLGRPDEAMVWLNRGYTKRDKGMDMLFVDPVFDGCRSDPHFQNLLRRMKLPGRL